MYCISTFSISKNHVCILIFHKQINKKKPTHVVVCRRQSAGRCVVWRGRVVISIGQSVILVIHLHRTTAPPHRCGVVSCSVGVVLSFFSSIPFLPIPFPSLLIRKCCTSTLLYKYTHGMVNINIIWI